MDLFATEAEERLNRIRHFKPIVANAGDAADAEKKETRSGKLLANAHQSDLYSKISVPSLAYLTKFSSEKFTDEMGRLYWDALMVSFDWDRLQDIIEHPRYNVKYCSIFYVRPKRGQELTLPEEGSKVLLYPMGSSSTSDAIEYECIWSGNDEDSTNAEKTNKRKSAFVMYQRL